MWNLVADVGGTNMRLAAISSAGSIVDQQTFYSKGDLDFLKACEGFVAAHETPPDGAVVAAAGVVADGSVRLTNSEQSFSEAELASACQTGNAKILNDFEAAAWSLATVADRDKKTLQGPSEIAPGPRLIIGPGTGLGVGAMVWVHGQPHVVPGEGGHVSLAPQSEAELAYFEKLLTLWPEVRMGRGVAVEAEAILSGTGVPVLYEAIALTLQADVHAKSTEQVFSMAKAGSDQSAVFTVDLFRRFLGQIAGDLALVFNATGGVFITGGVILKNPWVLDQCFLDAFNAGGRHSAWRAAMPIHFYQNHDFGLLGARNYISTR
jgi:glucokinase